MANVNITPAANKELFELPLTIRLRMAEVIERLEKWPSVSGAKPLRGALHGSFRIRTGDYRVIFEISRDGQTVTITKIGNRGSIYE